jgi:hypothetical protein
MLRLSRAARRGFSAVAPPPKVGGGPDGGSSGLLLPALVALGAGAGAYYAYEHGLLPARDPLGLAKPAAAPAAPRRSSR